MNRRHAKLVFGIEISVRRLQHFLDDIQVIVLGRSMQKIVLAMSSRLDRRRMFLHEILKLRAEVRVIVTVVLDEVLKTVMYRQLPVDGEERVFAVLLDLVVPELRVVIY